MTNNGRQVKEKPRYKFTRAWNWKKVIGVERSKEIIAATSQLAGKAPGEPGWIAKYQAGLSQVCDGLTKEEIKAAEELAEEWNARGPDKANQHTNWEKNGITFLKNCADAGFHDFGVRMTFMVTVVNADGSISIVL
jgi:hypothetical protein